MLNIVCNAAYLRIAAMVISPRMAPAESIAIPFKRAVMGHFRGLGEKWPA
jgi:hypothetical protein